MITPLEGNLIGRSIWNELVTVKNRLGLLEILVFIVILMLFLYECSSNVSNFADCDVFYLYFRRLIGLSRNVSVSFLQVLVEQLLVFTCSYRN